MNTGDKGDDDDDNDDNSDLPDNIHECITNITYSILWSNWLTLDIKLVKQGLFFPK